MAVKFYELEDIGTIRISKRSGTRNLRLSISASGEVRVTIPSWTPYSSGIAFVRSKSEWILSNIPAKKPPLTDGYRIGKAHQLVFASAAVDKPTSRIVGTEIRITRPIGMAVSHSDAQIVAHRASIRALRLQAESLLPQRLKTLADKHGFAYNSVSIKRLKGRWGSCDNKQDIVLNLFLMQLPWQLIDYVLLHELTHTKFLNHGEDFWKEFMRHEPTAKKLQKVIKTHKPVLEPTLS